MQWLQACEYVWIHITSYKFHFYQRTWLFMWEDVYAQTYQHRTQTGMRICGHPHTLKSKCVNQQDLFRCLKLRMFWGVFNDYRWTACIKFLAALTSTKENHKKPSKGVHIRLVFHAFPVCLMTRKRFLQQQEKQEYLGWALHKALVFPQSPVETELPVHPTLQSAFHFLIQVRAEPYQGTSTTLLKQRCLLSAVVGKHKCWSVNRSQDSPSGIWKAAALRGVVSSIHPSTFLKLKIPLKEVICS